MSLINKGRLCVCCGLLTLVATVLCGVNAQHSTTFLIPGLLTTLLVLMTTVLFHMALCQPADSHSCQTLILQYLIMKAMITAGRLFYYHFVRSTRKVMKVQDEVLRHIVQHNKDTVYGTKFSFCDISSREQFISRHPLTTYRHYEPYIESISAGHQNVLTADDVVYLGLSSGTTGKCKRIPITLHMKHSFGPKLGALMYYCMQQKAGLTLKRVFILSYQVPMEKISSGLCEGPVTAYMSRVVPFALSPRASFSITNEQAAIYVHAVFALREREVGHIEALTSPLIYSFWQFLRSHWKTVCSDIESGTLSMTSSLLIKPEIISDLHQQLRPLPDRAQELRACFLGGFYGLAKRIWPNLRFARMLTTGSFAHYANVLRSREMRDVTQVSTLHAASEGFMGINLSPLPRNFYYTAMINYGFLEFIPEERMGEDQPGTLFCEQLKLGDVYEIVLTTPMGLYRYRTGDVVKVVDFFNQCPVYDFMYRAGQAVGVYWEKTSEYVLYKAVRKAVGELTDTWLCDFTATEHYHLPPGTGPPRRDKRYVLFVEMEARDNTPRGLLTDGEMAQFDECLCQTSEIYHKLRNTGSIGMMQVEQVMPHTFQELKVLMIEKSQSQQFKMPRVLRNKDYIQFLWDRKETGKG